MTKTLSRLFLAAALLGATACGEDTPPPPPPIPPGAATPGAVPGAQPVAPAVGTPTPAQGGASNFGTISLNPGFMPDPHTATGTSGGQIQASNLDPTCRGWISQTPDHIFNAAGNFATLRVAANGGSADTTLVIQGPDGAYRCNDDSGGSLHPLVAGPFAPGQYKIWVGSYRQGVQAPYTLGVSELGSTTAAGLPAPAGAPSGGVQPVVPNPGAAGLDFTGAQSNFGSVALNPGFMPDPHVATGTSGGAVHATGLGTGCRGWIAGTPDHFFNATGAFANLKIVVNSQSDTTLVVRRPDGTFMCNDDSQGLNPAVSGAFPPGQYRVWVGSYSQGRNSPYRIGFSELASTTPSSI